MVYYQPLVDVRSGKVVAAEALARWRHPERGLIMPADFIPFAEETGLILPIGEAVMRRACADARDWQAAGFPHVGLAINISAKRLQQTDLTKTVHDLAQDYGLDPRSLTIELTESAIIQDVAKAVKVLQALREMGCSIAIDDFGTGYSSLAYLRRLPVDLVKIDRSFIAEVDGNGHDAAIVSTMMAMARGLGLRVVAEGVETAGQLEFIREQECDLFQGLYFSRPVPLKTLRKILAGKQAAKTTAAIAEE